MDQHTIELETPIIRGDTTHTHITLSKPRSGALRGLKLLDLLNGDVTSTIRLVPRISQPTLTEAELINLEPADLLKCADAVAAFLQPKAKPEASPEA